MNYVTKVAAKSTHKKASEIGILIYAKSLTARNNEWQSILSWMQDHQQAHEYKAESLQAVDTCKPYSANGGDHAAMTNKLRGFMLTAE